MTDDLLPIVIAEKNAGKHPPISSISDVFTFKMNRLVWITERESLRWIMERFGVSLNEWRILALIKANSCMRAGDLADFMLMDKSQLSRVIKTLTSKRFVASQPDPEDARGFVLRLTSKGEAMYGDMIVEILRKNETILSPLSAEEVRQLHDMLDRLTEHALTLSAGADAKK